MIGTETDLRSNRWMKNIAQMSISRGSDKNRSSIVSSKKLQFGLGVSFSVSILP